MFIRIIITLLVLLSNSIAEEISGIPKVVDGVLLLEVDNDSPFADKLEPLTVIIEINGNAVESVDGIEKNLIMDSPNRFYVWAGGKKRFVILKL